MLELFIGDKNYSTWSMRPWLVIQHFNIPFTEHLSKRALNPIAIF